MHDAEQRMKEIMDKRLVLPQWKKASFILIN
jgi:hypothetical protein